MSRKNIIRQLLVDQTFLDDRHPPIEVKVIPEPSLDACAIDWLAESSDAKIGPSVGIHPVFATKGDSLTALAISTRTRALLISSIVKNTCRPLAGRSHLQDVILANSDCTVFAFDGHELVLAIHQDMHSQCSNVVDILSLTPGRDRNLSNTVKVALGRKVEIFQTVQEVFAENKFDEKESTSHATLAQKAWLAFIVGNTANALDVGSIPRIDTCSWTSEVGSYYY